MPHLQCQELCPCRERQCHFGDGVGARLRVVTKASERVECHCTGPAGVSWPPPAAQDIPDRAAFYAEAPPTSSVMDAPVSRFGTP